MFSYGKISRHENGFTAWIHMQVNCGLQKVPLPVLHWQEALKTEKWKSPEQHSNKRNV